MRARSQSPASVNRGRLQPRLAAAVEHGGEGKHDKRREEPDGRVRPGGDFGPSLIGDHAGVAVVSHLLHVGLERAATTVGHHAGGSMNNLWPLR